MAMIFDTLKLSKGLREADFSEAQADAFAAARSTQVQRHLATKADLLQLEVKIGEKLAEIRNGMSLMRADTIKRVVTAIAFNFVATAGLFVTFFKLFAK